MNRRSFLSPALPAFLVLTLLLGACSDDDGDEVVPTTDPGSTGAVQAPAENGQPGTTPAPVGGSGLPAAEAIAWAPCLRGPFDCAEYDVPLDYADPEGASITLALRRLSAEDAGQRIGLLFVNPGGPGGSTIDILSGWARSLPSELRERFDVILFDPRGVGHSSPLRCGGDIQELIGLNPNPETREDWDEIVDVIRGFAEACGRENDDILPHLGTQDVARDMDRIREAEGEDAITYFGYSYGTTLGQVYADLFPTRVRAMVLDGAVDNSLSPFDATLEQILGFEAAFRRYLADCTARQCVEGDPEETFRSLIVRAAEDPIPASVGDRPAGAGEVTQAIIGSLYSRSSWTLLTLGVNAALAGDSSTLLFLADSLAGRKEDGSYGNLVEANTAVNCLDDAADRDPEYHIGLAPEFEARAPFFGLAAAQFGLYCAFWQAEPQPLTAPVAAGAPPILVIGTTGDAATPYKWAVSLADQLESGILVTSDAEGHGAYRIGGSSCIDGAVNAYLLDLTLPPEGLTCGNAGIEPVPPIR